MFKKMGGHIARRRGPERDWCPPRGWVGFLGCDVRRDLSPGEVPDLDAAPIPQMRIHTTSDEVELVAIGSGVGVLEATASVVSTTASALTADDNARYLVAGRG
jgi:hypothetical protein